MTSRILVGPQRIADPVEAEGDAAVGRRAVLERLEEVAESAPLLRRRPIRRKTCCCSSGDGCGCCPRPAPCRSARGRKRARTFGRRRLEQRHVLGNRRREGWCIELALLGLDPFEERKLRHPQEPPVVGAEQDLALLHARRSGRARWRRRPFGPAAKSDSRLRRRPWRPADPAFSPAASREELGGRRSPVAPRPGRLAPCFTCPVHSSSCSPEAVRRPPPRNAEGRVGPGRRSRNTLNAEPRRPRYVGDFHARGADRACRPVLHRVGEANAREWRRHAVPDAVQIFRTMPSTMP